MTHDTRERFTLRMPTRLYEMLQGEADKLGVSINAMVLNILWEWAEENKQSEED